MVRRRDGDWMMLVDERILEVLRSYGMTTPSQMTNRRVIPDDLYLVRERCRVLSQAGYVAPEEPNSRWYEITSEGVAYLRGRMLADYIYPHPSPRAPGHMMPRRVF